MKRLVKKILSAVWGVTGIVRRPIVRKVDAHIYRLIARAADQGHGPLMHEMNFAIDSMVRELVRLQMQVEEMQQIMLDLADRPADLTLVDPEEDFEKKAG